MNYRWQGRILGTSWMIVFTVAGAAREKSENMAVGIVAVGRFDVAYIWLYTKAQKNVCFICCFYQKNVQKQHGFFRKNVCASYCNSILIFLPYVLQAKTFKTDYSPAQPGSNSFIHNRKTHHHKPLDCFLPILLSDC